MGFDAGARRLILGHAVENTRRARLGEQGRAAAPVLDRNVAAAGLSGMVDKLDRAARHVGDLGPCAGDKFDCGVVVFAHAMAGDEGVDRHEADAVRPDRRYDRVDNRAGDLRA